MPQLDVSAVQSAVESHRDEIITFLREIVAIPSMNSQIGEVGERFQAEMKKLGFDEVWFDSMGNTLGRIGDGPRVIVFDSPKPLKSASSRSGSGETNSTKWMPSRPTGLEADTGNCGGRRAVMGWLRGVRGQGCCQLFQ